jgi:protein-disulfide isomerase
MNFALGPGRQIIEEYAEPGDVEFVYRHFAFLGEESFKASEASECAAEQGQFWEYHDLVYENWEGVNRGAYSDENLKGFARELSLDASEFDSCLDSGRTRAFVNQDIKAGEEAGIRSTPSVLINDRLIVGARNYEVYRQAIEDELSAAQ